MRLGINGVAREVEADPAMPLLWVLRDVLGLVGTKFGCGVGACGACTVWLDGQPVRACALPIGDVTGEVTTIEGLAAAAGLPEGALHPVQEAWMAEQVAQCGYCQSGQIMAAAALLRDIPAPDDADVAAAMTNLCRCGTYPAIRAAIARLAAPAPAPTPAPPPAPAPAAASVQEG